MTTETKMKLARVRGNVVASIKDSGLAAKRLLLLESVSAADPLASNIADNTHSKSVYVAVDLIGAGVGEVVLVTFGSAARATDGSRSAPTDAAVIAIVDAVQFDGDTTFEKH
jgi:microcompartment protein CcmK/EutM